MSWMERDLPGMYAIPELAPEALRPGAVPVPTAIVESHCADPLTAILKIGGWTTKDLCADRKVFVEVKWILDSHQKAQEDAAEREERSERELQDWWRRQGLPIGETGGIGDRRVEENRRAAGEV